MALWPRWEERRRRARKHGHDGRDEITLDFYDLAFRLLWQQYPLWLLRHSFCTSIFDSLVQLRAWLVAYLFALLCFDVSFLSEALLAALRFDV
jgi:hypothetical protein